MPVNDRKPATSENSKLVGLEMLRFLAAVFVLLWHYQHFWHVGATPVGFDSQQQPLYALFRPAYEWGVYGVQIFWLISGFIFFYKYLDLIQAGKISPRKFFVLRFSRLYPLHLVTFVMVAVLQAGLYDISGTYQVYPFNDAYHAVLQLFMASNWGLERGDSFNGPIWSVSLEILVYLFFYCLARFVGIGPWSTTFLVICGALGYQLRWGPVFQCLFFFFLGGGLVFVVRSTLFAKYQTLVLWTGLIYVIGALFLFGIAGDKSAKTLIHLYVVTAGPILVLIFSRPWHVPAWAAALAQGAGNTTYGSYLLHFPLQLVVMYCSLRFDFAVPKVSPYFLLAYVGLSIFLGWLSFRYFELPSQQRLRAWLLGKAPAKADPMQPSV